MAKKNKERDFISTVMGRVEENQILLEQETDSLFECTTKTYDIFGLDFYSMNESNDDAVLSLLEKADDLDEGELLGSLCEAFDLDPYDLSDEQLHEFFGMFKNRANRRGKLVKRFTKDLEGRENAGDRAKRKLQAHRIANQNPDGTIAGRRASRNPKGGKKVRTQIGDTTATRNTASVFNKDAGINNQDKFAKEKATKEHGKGTPAAQTAVYAAARHKADGFKRKRLGLSPRPQAATAKRANGKTMSVRNSTDIVRGARLALAERVLNALSEVEMTHPSGKKYNITPKQVEARRTHAKLLKPRKNVGKVTARKNTAFDKSRQ